MFSLKNVIFQPKNSLKLTLNMQKNAKLYLLSWALYVLYEQKIIVFIKN